jgi:membrane protein implicated in regulation of membrane protease activity
MIGSWATFWGWTLGISLVLFAVISVVVTIGGYRDIRSLLEKDEGAIDDGGGGRTDESADGE